ncbi:MAG TPA: acyltransferase family protein [Anaerolineales bacterium]|nr:acyltransferase family protein [Anaerolineales bacterium]
MIARNNHSIRQYELDWLRVIAILAVFVYHCSLIFAPDAYQIKNPTIYPYLDDIGALVGLWGMPLIFIISGASVFHALGKVNPGKYVKGMIARLVVPLVIGIFTHCAFQVYLESLHKGTFSGSFFEFYPHYFDGLYAFGGNFAWMGMHLWYLEALFLFSLLCLPLFLWLKKGARGQGLLRHLGNFLGKPGTIYLLALPVAALGYLLDPDGLGTTVLGGWSIFAYLVFFISGFVIISSEKFQASIIRMRWVSLVAAIVIWGVFDIIWGALGDPTFGTWQFVIGSTVWCLWAWCWLLAVLGFGFKHLTRNKPFLRYANEAVLPFYILHQPVVLSVAFFAVHWAFPDVLKFFIILGASFGIVMVLYEFMVRRFNPLRFLFGMKPTRRDLQVQAQEPQGAEPARTI